MKNHPVKRWGKWAGFNQTDQPDRLQERELVELLNAWCDPTGRIVKAPGCYPVAFADDLGVTDITGRSKMHSGARFRSKIGQQRALVVAGGRLMRSSPNNLYDPWTEITYPTDVTAPALDRPAAIVFKDNYGYHQNGEDIPFRVKMEEPDGSAASDEAEIQGLLPPVHGPKCASLTTGTLFPDGSITDYAVTFVYGNRGESGPSPRMSFALFTGTGSKATCPLTYIPIGPIGVTARRIYRTQIGHGEWRGYGAELQRQRAYDAIPIELFFLAEIPDNTTTTFTDGDTTATSGEDSSLDYSRRCPLPRPLPPRAKYQVVHQDRFAWANLREHPKVMAVVGDPVLSGTSTFSLSISNTGNGTITIVIVGGTGAGTLTISNYKTKSLREIWQEITNVPRYDYIGEFSILSGAGDGAIAIVAPGVDWERTYRFREVTNQNILGDANTFWFEAIDDDTDAVSVDGCERFPHRLMWSNALYPEEINPLNFYDLNKNDAYPVRGLFRNDFTLGIFTSEHVWLLTGSLSTDPDTFKPDFSIAATNSEAGNFCTRPDSIAVAPEGVFFVSEDGLRLYAAGRSKRIARGIDRRLLARIIDEPRSRDNVSLYYSKGKVYIAYPGMEVA